MQTHPIAWNASALNVPMAADPDRDERYRRMRERQIEDAPQARPSFWTMLTRRAA